MSEDERVIAQLRERYQRLIDEAEQVNRKLASALPQVVAAAREYRNATHHYSMLHCRDNERETLLALAARVGRRQTIFAQRSEVAAAQYAVESELHHINGWICATQIAIGVGKLAEMILGMLVWLKKVKEFVDVCKLVVDGAKAAQPQLAAGATIKGQGDIQADDYALGTAQLGAFLARLLSAYEKTGKHLWDLLALVRRARSSSDLSQHAATAMQGLKVIVDLLKSLIEATETSFGPYVTRVGLVPGGRSAKQVTILAPSRSGLAPALGKLSVALTALRDLIDGARAFYAAYEAFKEYSANAERMERSLQAMNRHAGNEETALRSLPSLDRLDPGAIETLAQATTNYNEARVLVDAARREAQRVKDDMDAANALFWQRRRLLKQALRPVSGDLDEMGELLTRIRYQTADLGFVRDRGGPRAAVARELIASLEQQRARLQPPYDELKALAAAAE